MSITYKIGFNQVISAHRDRLYIQKMHMKVLCDEKFMLEAAFFVISHDVVPEFSADIMGMIDVGKVPVFVLRLFGHVLRSD